MEPALGKNPIERERDRDMLLQQTIVDIISKHRYKTVSELARHLQSSDKSISLSEIRAAVYQLDKKRAIFVSRPNAPRSFVKSLTDFESNIAFWLVVISSVSVLAVIYFAPQTDPWHAARIVIGGSFLLFIPGYSVTELLYSRRELEWIIKIVLSIGLSLAIAALIGTVLATTPIGISLESASASLVLFSIVVVTINVFISFSKRQDHFLIFHDSP